MVTRKTTVKKKTPKVYSRRAQTGIAAAPVNSYHWFNDYIRTEVDKKEISSVVKSYIKKNFPKEETKLALRAPEWMYTGMPFLASIIAWKEKGFPFPTDGSYEKTLRKNIEDIIEAGRNKVDSEEEVDNDTERKPTLTKKSPAEIVKERASDFIAEIESVIDIWGSGVYLDIENYSPYNELQKIDAPYNLAKSVMDYYTPILDEAIELVNKKTPDLVEGFRHMSVKQRREYLSLLKRIVEDVEKYLLSKKALRKTRKPKVKTADKQIEKLTYLKESAEFKLVSIPAAQVIGASRLYLFNTSSRILTELVCRLTKGFEVKGTTIQGIDEEKSRQTLLRKPNEFLPIVQNKSPLQINKEWLTLTTKSNPANGRVNKDTILLRALDR